MTELRDISEAEVEGIRLGLQHFLEPLGFECHVFKIGWYNVKVGKPFQLLYDHDTVGVVILSTPKMFESTFLPYLKDGMDCQSPRRDPLDHCMITILSDVRKLFVDFDVDIIHDFELTATRRPRVLMQTAGHVSGAATFYQRSDLGSLDTWDENRNIMGVSLHPRYGGWFAFRAVIIWKNVICRGLPFTEPESLLKSKCEILHLLTLFNDHWQDGRYRDFIAVKEGYSDLQRKYFETPPSERYSVIKSILETA